MEIDEARNESGGSASAAAELDFNLNIDGNDNNDQNQNDDETAVSNSSNEELEVEVELGSSSGSSHHPSLLKRSSSYCQNLNLIATGTSPPPENPIPLKELSDSDHASPAPPESPNACQEQSFVAEALELLKSTDQPQEDQQTEEEPENYPSIMAGLAPIQPFHSTEENAGGVGNFSQFGNLSLSLNSGSTERLIGNSSHLNHSTNPFFLHNSALNSSNADHQNNNPYSQPSHMVPTGYNAHHHNNHESFSQLMNHVNSFPTLHSPLSPPHFHSSTQHPLHHPMPFIRPQELFFSNISEQPQPDPYALNSVYYTPSPTRGPQISSNYHHQVHNLAQMNQNSFTLEPSMPTSRLRLISGAHSNVSYHHDQLQPSQPMLSYPSMFMPRPLRGDESIGGSTNEVTRSYFSGSSPDSSQQNQMNFHQIPQQPPISPMELFPDQPMAVQYSRSKRTRNGTPKPCFSGDSSSASMYFQGDTNVGGSMNLSSFNSSSMAMNSSPRVTNSLYDRMYAEAGLPVDPHLRLFNGR